MTGYFHVSARVPWRDRPWDDKICERPLDNSSCVLLGNIGERRDDDFEASIAGTAFVEHDTTRLPCLSERATFMSPTGYHVMKTHPYSTGRVLSDYLQPTSVDIPPFGLEAVPFRWLNRQTFEETVWPMWDAGYDPAREDRVAEVLNFKPSWIMDGVNQQTVIRQFFDVVTAGASLVFFYLKNSPLQDFDNRRLLVGAAYVDELLLPGMWNQRGAPPFDSSMWETALVHSLRSDGTGGILLPYQDLVRELDGGRDVAQACAWAPQGHDLEFSYVTEHVSDDVAIQALQSLRSAVDGMSELGLRVPGRSVDWLEAEIERLWGVRGPTPGLGAALAYLGVDAAHRTARSLLAGLDPSDHPWTVVERGLEDPASLPEAVQDAFVTSARQTWLGMSTDERQALVLASTMQLNDEQVRCLIAGDTNVELAAVDFVQNPFWSAICTYGQPEHIEFATVDRALLSPRSIPWPSSVPAESRLEGGADRRRIQAALFEILEQRAALGDTLVPEADLVTLAAELVTDSPVVLTPQLLRGQGLDAAGLAGDDEWTPLTGAVLADGSGALKLFRLAAVADVLRDWIEPKIGGRGHEIAFDSRLVLDKVIDQAVVDDAEEAARAEKSAGLIELAASRVSVLVGAAGTGKTTMLRALTDLEEIKKDGVLLLAPTGKARVQLSQKVNADAASTIASFLSRSGRYDAESGRYLVSGDPASRRQVGLVVIDEASMLTEEMLAATLDGLKGVKRLILVGDHRQLPPIGAGRPFVDLVERLRPDPMPSPIRVAPGFVELTVLRRQGGAERDDLALAAWFGGGELPAGSDEIWQRLRVEEHSETLRHVSWAGDPLPALKNVLREEVLEPQGDAEKTFALSYGGRLDDTGAYVNWPKGEDGAGASCERWQILTPARSRIYGSTEINRHLKRTFRTTALRQAQRRGAKFPRPTGPEQIILGDKVMQTRNLRLVGYPKQTALGYVANGEIGVVVGKWGNWTGKRPLEVELSSQIGTTYTYWGASGEEPDLELAWAVTVHKAQGSEFSKTIVVLPQNARVSRELIYTALTRQRDRVILVHEGSVDDLFALAQPAGSETARRMTDLFRSPNPRSVRLDGGEQRFDGNLIHVTASGQLVRSKNEVIIADILEHLAPASWQYELRFTGSDGRQVAPDFTIETPAGDTVLWEHLGMLDHPSYAAKWAAKKRWYADNGVLPSDEGGGPRGMLITTDDRSGVDVPAWTALAERVLGSRKTRRPTKKAAASKRPPQRERESDVR